MSEGIPTSPPEVTILGFFKALYLAMEPAYNMARLSNANAV